MNTPRDDQLIADLRALRPAPRPQFAAKLDERAAAGFPRRSRLPRISLAVPRISPRRLLLPAGGLAILAIAITTAVVAFQEDNNGEVHLSMAGASRDPVPAMQQERATGATQASGAAESVEDASAGIELNFSAARLRQRHVERSAQLVLAAEPGDVAEDSRKVFEAVHAHDGIVMRSSTRQGAPGDAGARFELLIPTAKLGDALAALSAIDEVRFRHESTADITAPTANVSELLQDSKARIDSLLGQLEAAESESEREAVESELRQERRHRALLRSELQHLQRRAELSRVTLRIETGAAGESSGSGTWGVDDALGDAGHILTIAAAVTLIGLAVLAPIALIALLAWLTHRAWVRRERRRVLS
ncbi:MAG TPA: DUF4349 domain-containing protein [Solirubrobacterales bacterium]|nr:DUF4349 domain-containing protein [Solirubrobacterales bacterium]